MIRDIDTLKERVQKLLNQAADRGGTPEGDVFYEKAFNLMARYGFDERDLVSPGDVEMISRDYEFRGSYTDMQMQLLNAIVTGLHCAAIAVTRPRSTTVTTGTVFGLRQHVERVDLLFSILKPAMVALAMELREDDTPYVASLVSRRRSFMQGYSLAILRRLRHAEARVDDAVGSYALAVRDDAQRAEEFMHETIRRRGDVVSGYRSRRKLDATAFAAGTAEASRADLGQRRFSCRREITG